MWHRYYGMTLLRALSNLIICSLFVSSRACYRIHVAYLKQQQCYCIHVLEITTMLPHNLIPVRTFRCRPGDCRWPLDFPGGRVVQVCMG